MRTPTHRTVVRGFTLIELIVVIVILGVLAAVALPRFTNLQTDAHVSKANAMAGSVRAAAALTKSQAIVKAVPCGAATGETVLMEGQAITLAYCSPTADAGGIVLAANLDEAKDGVTIAHATGVTTISVNGAATAANCRVSYTEPTVADGAAQVVVDVSAC